MVSPGQATSRAYDALRRRIMTLDFRPGDRIDPALLADELGSSITPVRDALHFLGGEGLVEIRQGEGYFIPATDTARLTDLYDWSLDILLAALKRADLCPAMVPAPIDNPGDWTAAVFTAITRASPNRVHGSALQWINAQLAPARQIEALGLFDIATELASISEAITARDKAAVRKLLVTYHSARKRIARAISEQLCVKH